MFRKTSPKAEWKIIVVSQTWINSKTPARPYQRTIEVYFQSIWRKRLWDPGDDAVDKVEKWWDLRKQQNLPVTQATPLKQR